VSCRYSLSRAVSAATSFTLSVVETIMLLKINRLPGFLPASLLR
jgi:hypothetical protein